MASDIGDGDYLGAYRRFFVDFLKKINPDDQLPVRTSGHDVTEGEIVGAIIHMTLQYLDQQLCPPSLQCYIVQLVIEEIKTTCRKQPEACGFRHDEKTYAPLKLMQAVTSKVNEICQRYLENSRLALLPPPPSTPMPLATVFAIRNNRRKMEDRHVILHDLNTIFNIKDDSIASYYAVFDGHAGYHAAAFCATHLHQYLAESRHYPTDPERALRDAFLTTDASFVEKSTTQSLSSGATAVCALILNRKLYVAWAGDSQAALAKRGIVTQLVNPHKPDRNDEKERVEEMGGTVMHLGIWRVNGNLAVSRAIGDAQYKPYVTGDPEIRCITLDGHEDFLIIACDGLWDCVTENEASTLVYRDLCKDQRDYASTSQHLVEYAKEKGSVDNITVIVVFLASPRQIVARALHGNPLLADAHMNNMEQSSDNRLFLSNTNGQCDINNAGYFKQQNESNVNLIPNDPFNLSMMMTSTTSSSSMTMSTTTTTMRNNLIGGMADGDGEELGENEVEKNHREFGNCEKILSSNGERRENGDNTVTGLYMKKRNDDREEDEDEDEDDDDEEEEEEDDEDEMDLGPETDVDAIDDISETPANLANVSRQLFPDKDEPSEPQDDERDNDQISFDDNAKPHQRGLLIPDADNVGDSEDSEDEWNYYCVDPNKEKVVEGGAGGEAVLNSEPASNTENASSSSHEKYEDTKKELAEGERECTRNFLLDNFEEVTRTSALANAQISAETDFDPFAKAKEISVGLENDTEKVDERGEKYSDEKAEEEDEEEEERQGTVEKRELVENEEVVEDDMDFQLNPNAAEFVPISPAAVPISARRELADVPIAGSPLKRTPPMDDIKLPSRRQFQREIRCRPHEIDEKSFANGRFPDSTDVLDDAAPLPPPFAQSVNLDDSEISSTKAEYGDESSFLIGGEFQKPDVSILDGSYTGSYCDFDDSKHETIEKNQEVNNDTPISYDAEEEKEKTKNLLEEEKEKEEEDGEGEEDPLDLNAVHDLTDADLMADEAIKSHILEETNKYNHLNVDDHEAAANEETGMIMGKEDNTIVASSSTENLLDPSMPEYNSHSASLIDQPMATEPMMEYREKDDEGEMKEDEEVEEAEGLDDTRVNETRDITTETRDDELLREKLSGMDLEDRGSEVCKFEKFNEAVEAYEETMEMAMKENDEDEEDEEKDSENSSSAVVSQEIINEGSEKSLKQSCSIDDITKSMEELGQSRPQTPSNNIPVIMHNPLDLDVARPVKDEEPVLEDECAARDEYFDAGKKAESPEVGVSPMAIGDGDDATNTKNPFDQVEFVPRPVIEEKEADSCTLPVRENVAGIAGATKNGKKDEEDEEDEQQQQQQQHESVNNECLKLSESLQEFTGLESQLNPKIMSNGESPTSRDENLLDIRDEEPTALATITNARTSPETIKKISEEVENKLTELIGDTGAKMTPEEKEIMMENASKVVESVAATVAKVAETAVATKTTAKATPTAAGTKVVGKTGSGQTNKTVSKKGPINATKNKSTPTSPTKSNGASAPARTSALGVAAKTRVASATARPNKLEASGNKTSTGVGIASATKSTSSTTTSAKNQTKTSKVPGGRPASSSSKPLSATASTVAARNATKSTVASEKKMPSGGGGDAVTAKTMTGTGRAKLASAATQNGANGKTTSLTKTTATKPKIPPSSSSSTASKITSKSTLVASSATTTTTTTTSHRPKTAPALTRASRLAGATINATTAKPTARTIIASTKSPITEKQLKETANKRISSARTTATTAATTSAATRNSLGGGAQSKITNRTSGVSSTNRRQSMTKVPANGNNKVVPPPPIRKPAGATGRLSINKISATNGKATKSVTAMSMTTTTTTTTTKTCADNDNTAKNIHVVENGVAAIEHEQVSSSSSIIDNTVTDATTTAIATTTMMMTTTTTTTTMVTSVCNDEDVPIKDISPIEPPTDNQLIITAD